MKVLHKIENDSLVLYREKWGAIAFSSALAIGCAIFGWVFKDLAYPDSKIIAFKWGGYFFYGVGILIIIQLLSMLRTIFRNNGLHSIIFNKSKLIISPHISFESFEYDWAEIKSITLIKKYSRTDIEGTSNVKNAMIINFVSDKFKNDSLLQRGKRDQDISPEGNIYTLKTFPKKLPINDFLLTLKKFVPDTIEIETKDEYSDERVA
jgi:hypothetical protein